MNWKRHIKGIRVRSAEAWSRFGKPKQTTWAFCPSCNRDLCSTPGVTYTDEEVVTYTCTCGFVSRWDFDAPAPIYLRPDDTLSPLDGGQAT